MRHSGRDEIERAGEASTAPRVSLSTRAALLLVLSLAALIGLQCPSYAQDVSPTEYEIKAAFVFNFAKFVEWPEQTFNGPTAPFVFGILGDNPFHEDLARTIRNKTIDGHPLVVREFHSVTQATNCQLLFISASERSSLSTILQVLNDKHILTVSEMDHFTELGGMINFVFRGTKVRFQINQEAANKAGLKVSSKLMNLAVAPGS